MEKVIYRNRQSGKLGTLVRENKRFKQYILEVDGENIAYSSATIKRWWEVVSTEEVETIKTVKEASIKEADHKKEITSISRTKKETVSAQPKKMSKEEPITSSPDVSSQKGPDMEVFHYIQEAGNKEFEISTKGNLIIFKNSNKRVLEVRVCRKHISLHTIATLKVPKNVATFQCEIKGTNLRQSYIVDYSNYKEAIPEILKQLINL